MVNFPHLNEPQSLVQVRKAMYWERWRVVLGNGAKNWGIMSLVFAAALSLAFRAAVHTS